MKGRVLKSTGSWYQVLAEDQKIYPCRMRGKIRLEDIKASNPVAVGDFVHFDSSQQDGNIEEILPRKNYIERKSVKKTAHSHVLAANIDQVLLVATLKQPRTSLGFIDRFLVTAESFRIPQVILFNKMDLLSKEELFLQGQWIALYASLDIRPIAVSLLEDRDVTAIMGLLKNKATLVAGHSGSGKSTLLNRLSTAIGQKVGDISDFSNKGIHTTTFAEMFRLDHSTFIIDTPGVKEWAPFGMTQQEISDYFPELRELRAQCRFGSRCLHLTEPQCAVLEALAKGNIADSRYQSYESIVSNRDSRA